MKQIIKAAVALTPYRIVRNRGANRFDAVQQSLIAMRNRGFRPEVVVDGGAHLGTFSIAAKKIFPNAHFHLIEPQAACAASLRSLSVQHGFVLHECALSDQAGLVKFSKTLAPETGAQINPHQNEQTSFIAATTLDALFGTSIEKDMRVLLKLDLQGYEISALRGATTVLQSVEAILTEVSFFGDTYGPSIAKLIAFMDERGFELYDIALLSARLRDDRLKGGDFIFCRRGSALLADVAWS